MHGSVGFGPTATPQVPALEFAQQVRSFIPVPGMGMGSQVALPHATGVGKSRGGGGFFEFGFRPWLFEWKSFGMRPSDPASAPGAPAAPDPPDPPDRAPYERGGGGTLKRPPVGCGAPSSALGGADEASPVLPEHPDMVIRAAAAENRMSIAENRMNIDPTSQEIILGARRRRNGASVRATATCAPRR